MKIGDKPFIVAELSGNHGGDLRKCLDMIVAAKKCGCDAVKIQLYEPEDLCDPGNNHMYEKYKTPREWLPHLFNSAKAVGVPLFSSVFALWAVDFLAQFDCSAMKLASPESTRVPPLTYEALWRRIKWHARRELWISSGRADMEALKHLPTQVRFYCKAGYPATIDAPDIEYAAGLANGFSDHTADIIAPLAMIGAGIKVIEKHFKLDDDCVDTAFSLNPDQMEILCRIAHR